MTDLLDPALDDPADTPDSFARGLRGYADAVARELGVGLESCAIDANPPASIYIALDRRLAAFPGRDLALLWDERFGWSAAIETRSGEDLLIIAYLEGDPLPDPETLGAFVAGLPGDRSAGRRVPQPADDTALRETARRLRAYAVAD